MSNGLNHRRYGRLCRRLGQLGLGAIASCIPLGHGPLLASPAPVSPPPARLTSATPEPIEPPSPFWLLAMPLLPLAGGGLTYLVRRAQAKNSLAESESGPKPPDPSA